MSRASTTSLVFGSCNSRRSALFVFFTKGCVSVRRTGLDLIVEGAIVVEMKSVAALLPVHSAQVLTYMKLTNCPFGLLINFNVPKLTDGVKRLVLPGYEAKTRGTDAGEAGIGDP